MSPTKKIKRIIKNTKMRTNPEVNERVLEYLLNELDETRIAHSAGFQGNVRRIITKSTITKLSAAAAAVMILLGLVGILLPQHRIVGVSLGDVREAITMPNGFAVMGSTVIVIRGRRGDLHQLWPMCTRVVTVTT